MGLVLTVKILLNKTGLLYRFKLLLHYQPNCYIIQEEKTGTANDHALLYAKMFYKNLIGGVYGAVTFKLSNAL